jgi:hypothetical protein
MVMMFLQEVHLFSPSQEMAWSSGTFDFFDLSKSKYMYMNAERERGRENIIRWKIIKSKGTGRKPTHQHNLLGGCRQPNRCHVLLNKQDRTIMIIYS